MTGYFHLSFREGSVVYKVSGIWRIAVCMQGPSEIGKKPKGHRHS